MAIKMLGASLPSLEHDAENICRGLGQNGEKPKQNWTSGVHERDFRLALAGVDLRPMAGKEERVLSSRSG